MMIFVTKLMSCISLVVLGENPDYVERFPVDVSMDVLKQQIREYIGEGNVDEELIEDKNPARIKKQIEDRKR